MTDTDNVISQGETVLALNKNDGLFYEGVVNRMVGFRAVEVYLEQPNKHSNQYTVVLPLRYCLLKSTENDESAATTELKPYDTVLLQMEHLESGVTCYVPARVLPRRSTQMQTSQDQHKPIKLPLKKPSKIVTVELFTGKQHNINMRKGQRLMKISPSLYDVIVQLIEDRNSFEKDDYRVKPYVSPEEQAKRDKAKDEAERLQRVESRLHRHADKLSQLRRYLHHEMRALHESQRKLTKSLPSLKEERDQQREMVEGLRREINLLEDAVLHWREQQMAEEEESETSSSSNNSDASTSSIELPLSHRSVKTGEDGDSEYITSPVKRPKTPLVFVGRRVVAEVGDSLQFFEGVITEKLPNQQVRLTDRRGHTFLATEDRIFCETLDQVMEFHSQGSTCHVLAPGQTNSDLFQPAEMMLQQDDKESSSANRKRTRVLLRFADGQERKEMCGRCYVLSPGDYEMILERIKEQRQLQDRGSLHVVARDNRSGVFFPGTFLNRGATTPLPDDNWDILLANGEVLRQQTTHIFRLDVPSKTLLVGEKVLARFGASAAAIFLPGWVAAVSPVSTWPILVHFYHGEQGEVALKDVVVISESYYKNCILALKNARNSKDVHQ